MQRATAETIDLRDGHRSGLGKLRPRARLLNSIGAELISSEIVAVIELVRNSYDADARRVQIIFSGLTGTDTPALEIRDDGHGMTREVLLGPWMEPATDYKSSKGTGQLAGERSPAGRRRLGSKGVGRFASQRLGRHLDLSTRMTGAPLELNARFDWSDIERPDRYLDEMEIPWAERPPDALLSQGTVLRITSLRDEWTPDRFEKLRVALARLLSPDHGDDSFGIELVIEGRRETVGSLIDRSQSMYSLEGELGADGHVRIVYRDLQGNEEQWERGVLWPTERDKNCGPFRFRLSAWDLDREPLLHYLKTTGNPLGLRDFRRSLRDHSGVSLYRDGFRILPYGESDNDWLRLDRRRINNPTLRLSNNQVLGVIQLTADGNPELKDQTNREGLVTNSPYEHLREVVCELLGYLENRRFAARRANEMGFNRGGSRLPELTADVDQKIDGLVGELSHGTGSGRVKALQAALEERRQAEAETIRLYSGLATSGQLSGMIFGQLGHYLLQVDSELALLGGDLSFDLEDLDEGFLDDLQWSLDRLRKLTGEMRAKVERLDPLASPGRGRRLKEISLGECVTVVLDAFQDLFAEAEVDLRVQGDHTTLVRTNSSVVQQALAAILDNALYWVAQRKKGRVVVVELDAKAITISNNGPAIAPADLEHVFEPHFTRRPDAAGLGLALAADLMQTIGGRVGVTRESGVGFSILFG